MPCSIPPSQWRLATKQERFAFPLRHVLTVCRSSAWSRDTRSILVRLAMTCQKGNKGKEMLGIRNERRTVASEMYLICSSTRIRNRNPNKQNWNESRTVIDGYSMKAPDFGWRPWASWASASFIPLLLRVHQGQTECEKEGFEISYDGTQNKSLYSR